jgi:hypothetical protein
VEELNNDLPIYILPGSPAEPIWRSQNPNGWKKQPPYDTQTLEVHLTADRGDIERLEKLAAENERILHLKDKNGWQPIHEAARAGHIDVVKFLLGKESTLMYVPMMETVTHPLTLQLMHWEVITLFPSIC